MANRFWVGGGSSTNWNATGNTNWGSASNTRDNASVPVGADAVTFDNSAFGNNPCTLTTNATCLSADLSAYTNTLTHPAVTWIVQTGPLVFNAGMTYTISSGFATIQMSGGNVTTAGLLMPSFITAGATITLQDNFTTAAQKGFFFRLASNNNGRLNLNGKTISGNSSINRLLFLSDIVGTARLITNATANFANADFQDINFQTATSLNLAAITGLSGDCGGNTISGGGTTLTFTTSATQTATGTASFTWSTHGWTSRVPLPQDDVVINNAFIAGRNITADMPRLGRSIDFTGETGGVTINFGSTANSIFGSLTFITDIIVTGTQSITFAGRGSYSITSAGKTFPAVVNITAPSGSYSLIGAISAVSNIVVNNGTFVTNSFDITTASFQSTNTNTRSITLGTSTVTANSTAAGNSFSFATTTGLTFSGASATFVISTTSANTRTFQGGGLIFGTLQYNVAGSTGELDITGANTFSAIKFSDVTNARSLKFTAATTTTLTVGSGWQVNGTSGKKMTVDSITSATWTLAITAGTVVSDFLTLSNSTASGSVPAYAGANSTNGGGNTNWNFTGRPAGGMLPLLGIG